MTIETVTCGFVYICPYYTYSEGEGDGGTRKLLGAAAFAAARSLWTVVESKPRNSVECGRDGGGGVAAAASVIWIG